MADQVLHGGVANAGAVVRQGQHVLRPSNPHTPTLHSLLAHVASTGFDGASQPVGIDDDGRERLVFIDGDVAIPPYPAWVQSSDALQSIARLLRSFHDATRSFEPAVDATWSDEMADPLDPLAESPVGAPIPDRVICHNDVCLENVVFRNGVAVGLFDFDFAAPGRSLYDLAQFARMCVPVDDEINAARLGWQMPDIALRLRLVADAYGLPPDRTEFLSILSASIEAGGQFVLRRVQAGDPNFIAMWNAMGGMERFDRRRQWFAAHRDQFLAALG